MEETFFVTEEQKQILYEVTHQVHEKMFEAICTHNNERFDEIIMRVGYQFNDVDAICVMRLGTPYMQQTYWNRYTKFSLQAETEMFLYADAEFINSILNDWPLELENFKAILKRDDIKIIATAINFCIFDNCDNVLAILQERNRPLELALFYNVETVFTPEGFWLQEENIKILENNLNLFNDISPNTFLAIINKPELRKNILEQKMLSRTSANVLIALYQAKATEEEIRLLAQDFSPSIRDFYALHQSSKELFELIVKNCKIDWNMLWDYPLKQPFVVEIAELRLSEADVTRKMFDNPNGADLVWVLKNKNLWHENYLYFVHKYPALLSELKRYIQFNKATDKLLLDRINIWKLKDFNCAKAYIEKFGIDKDDEQFLELFINPKERDTLLCLAYDKCGLRSKKGKHLWLQYCKYNPDDMRVTFVDKLKAYFCC